MLPWHAHHVHMPPCEQQHLQSTQSCPVCEFVCSTVDFPCRCDSNTCARTHVSNGVNHSVFTNGMQRVYHALHSIQQWQFDRPNSSSDHRSGLEQLSNRPASGAGRAHLLLAEVHVRLRRLICDRSRQLRERPLAKHECAGLLPPPLQSVGLFTNI